MSLTGTYVHRDGKMVKVSDAIPNTIGSCTSDVCDKVKEPYWDEHITGNPILVKSRSHKAKLLKANGLTQKQAVHGGLNEF